ncbi:MAG: 50S ribosomal protein L25 [Patescibacteria group bacterium]
MLTLPITKRSPKEKLEAIRKAGNIPAVFYGPKEKSTPITINLTDFKKIWKQAGETAVIELKGDGIDVQALIHELDIDPVKSTVRHADFYAVDKDQKVKIHVPLEFVGVAPAVKDLGGILIKVLHSLEIEALPKDLPQKIAVDLALLTALDSRIAAKEIKLPTGVTLVAKPEEVVANIAQVKEEVVEEAPADIANIEISEKRGKEVKEGEAPAAGDAKAPPASAAKK